MKKKISRTVCAALAVMVMVSGYWMADQTRVDTIKVDTTVPQLVSYVDALDGTITIEGEETPLAAKSVVKKTVTTKKNTQKIKMATKAKKSSKKTTKKTVKTSSTQVTSTQKIKTDKTILTTTVTTLKKKSKVKTIKTTIKTTTTTTTTKLEAVKNNTTSSTTSNTTVGSAGSTNSSSSANSSSSSSSTGTAAVVKKTVAVKSIAPKAHANVLSAYEKMGFSVKVDSTVNYSGKFDARAQEITVQKNSEDAIYHELGHFVAFAAGNVDQTAEFNAIYKKEIDKFSGTRNNDSYIKSTPEEYFAESYQDYVERPDVLKKQRPQTYQYVVESVNKVTDARATLLKQIYASVWK